MNTKSEIRCRNFVFVSLHPWLAGLDPGRQRRAEMSNFVFHIAWIFDRLRDFLADKPAITPPQIVQLFFDRGFCYSQRRSQAFIRDIFALRRQVEAQRLKQSEPPFALTFLAQTPKRLFDYGRSPPQIEQLLR